MALISFTRGLHHTANPGALFKLSRCLSSVGEVLVSSSAAAVPLSGCGYAWSRSWPMGWLASLDFDLSWHRGRPWWSLGCVWPGYPQQVWSSLWLVLPAWPWTCLITTISWMALAGILGLPCSPGSGMVGLGLCWWGPSHGILLRSWLPVPQGEAGPCGALMLV